MTPAQIAEIQKTWNEFKEQNEKSSNQIKAFGTTLGDTNQKLTSISSKLDEMEAKIAADKTNTELKADNDKLKGRLDELEAGIKASTLASAVSKAATTEEGQRAVKALAKKAFLKGIVYYSKAQINPNVPPVENVLSADELKYWKDLNDENGALRKSLVLSTDTAGGYLAPPEYVAEILMDVVQFSPIRSIARVRPTTRHSIQIPRRTATAAASWVGETGSRTETTNPQFGMKEIRTHELYAMTKISWAELEDSAFDLEGFIKQEFSTQFAYSQGAAFVAGNGVAKPEGFLTPTDVYSLTSSVSASIAPDDLITLLYELKEEYLTTARFVLNRGTLKTVRQMKDSVGQYLWAPGIRSDSRPAEILGQPYVVAPDMPSLGASNVAVAFGAFDRGYLIVDRLVMQMMTDPYTSKSVGQVEFSGRTRVGGEVVIAEAIKTLTCAA